jgi:hypothetical protein
VATQDNDRAADLLDRQRTGMFSLSRAHRDLLGVPTLLNELSEVRGFGTRRDCQDAGSQQLSISGGNVRFRPCPTRCAPKRSSLTINIILITMACGLLLRLNLAHSIYEFQHLLSRLIQIGSVPIILRPAVPFDSGTHKLIVRSRQSWCQFTEIATRIAELISRLGTDSAKNSETGGSFHSFPSGRVRAKRRNPPFSTISISIAFA